MSMQHTGKVTCPKCKTQGDFMVWGSINTTIDPEMKEKVLSGEAFRFTCKKCGNKAHVDYGFLYHQMEDQVMIHYVTDEDNIEKIRRMFSESHQVFESRMKLEKNIAEGYRNRIVTSQNALREKIMIFSAGLDDRVIEIIKILCHMQYSEKHPNAVVEEIYFNQLSDGADEFLFINEDKSVTNIVFPQKMYAHAEKIYADKINLLSEEIAIIDFDWAVQVLKNR